MLSLLELLIEKPVTALRLYNNKLTALPESIGNLVNLKVLNLSNNQLTEVPKSIGKLEKLEWLYLRNNQLNNKIKDWLRQQFCNLGNDLKL